MSFNIEFQHEWEELGLVLQVNATYANSGGGGDEPTYGPECEDISASIIGENGENDDIWDELRDIYLPRMNKRYVWKQGQNGWVIEDTAFGHMNADMAAMAFLPKKIAPRLFEKNANGQQFVYLLTSLQNIIKERADEKAGEAEMDGAGGPDPDEAHDRMQDEGF